MTRITINLARRPPENLRRIRIVWGGSLIALAVLLGLLSTVALVQWLGSRPIQAQTNALRRQMAPLEAQVASDPNPTAAPQTQAVIERAAFFNRLIDQKAVSWTLLFQQLEQIQPPGVELVSLHPLVRNGANAMDIRFVSNDLPSAIAFVRKLEASGDFADARVERETETSPTGTGVQLAPAGPRFHLEVTALYKGEPE